MYGLFLIFLMVYCVRSFLNFKSLNVAVQYSTVLNVAVQYSTVLNVAVQFSYNIFKISFKKSLRKIKCSRTLKTRNRKTTLKLTYEYLMLLQNKTFYQKFENQLLR